MSYRHEDRLFIASNDMVLRYYDFSNPRAVVTHSIPLSPSLPTSHPPSGLHEVKGCTLQNGKKLIGLGIPRMGMCMMTFNSDWTRASDSVRWQIYEFNRATFPGTVINPHKKHFDNNYSSDPSRSINDKWDWRVCHSVIPYDQNSGHYVLTVDEYTNHQGYQRKNGMWLRPPWEAVDFYNPYSSATPSNLDTAWYDSQVLYSYNCHDSSIITVPYSGTLTVPAAHSLNYNHWNYPGRPWTDPNKLQGAFVRIWNRDSLWHNDTTSANNHHLIVGAYDVQEDPDHPIGYFGIDNIPDSSIVPSGLHEPILIGRRLYLGGYNTGARVLDVNGAELSLRAYVRTENYLSNDTNSVNFYARPDIIMYAKGIYRLIPDMATGEVLFGSDIYNGTWIMRFYDSTITGTIAHNSFQPCVEIGTADSTKPQTFTIAGTVTIPDTGCVTLADHTTFKHSCGASIANHGALHIGSVDFDTTGASACTDPFLFVRPGGTLELGDEGVTINGMPTIVIDSGGTATIKEGVTLNMAANARIIVNGVLYIESSAYETKASLLCQKGGVIIITANSTLEGIHTIDIEQTGGLTLANRCVLRMADSGRIALSTCMATMGITDSALFEGKNHSSFGTWLGITVDSLIDGNCTLSKLVVHDAVQGIATFSSYFALQDCELSNNYEGIVTSGLSPLLQGNRFERNYAAGIVATDMVGDVNANRIRNNDYFGVIFEGGDNIWRSNRVDSNGIGFAATNLSNPRFNETDQYGNYNTTNGNGIRWNNIVGVRGYNESVCFFLGDNSVHSNVGSGNGLDFQLLDTSVVWGMQNYKPQAQLFIQMDPGTYFFWPDATPPINADPVLPKAVAGPPAWPGADSRFTEAINIGVGKIRTREHRNAATAFEGATSYASSRAE
jgi:hypothetical protein